MEKYTFGTETRRSISVCFFFIPFDLLLKTRMGNHYRAKLRTTRGSEFCTPGPEFCTIVITHTRFQ